jgi:ParB family chromosome partitioning protein
MPEDVKVDSIMVVEHGRLPIDEAVVKDIMATIAAGAMSALPPIHLWRREPGGNPILVAGRNRLDAHKRSGCEVISARIITGDAPEIIRAVQLVEIDENLSRRELSPALRRSLSKQRKALYEEEHPETKRGSSGGRARAGKDAKSQNATEQTPAFIDAHAKQTGRHRATIAREISEAAKIGDDVLKKIVGTSLDRQSEITALAAMDEQERQEIVDRAVAGEKVSAAKTQRAANERSRTEGSASDYDHGDADTEDHEAGAVPEVIPNGQQPQADDRDVPAADAYARWLTQYEAIEAKQAALARELEELYRPLVSAITIPNTPVDPKMSGVGEVRSTSVPKLDPLAWTMSTLDERIQFIQAIGRRDIELIFDAIEHMAPVQATQSAISREPAEPGAVTPEKFETQNDAREDDCKFDPRFQKKFHRTTPEILSKHVAQNPNPEEETVAERHIRHWHERERAYRDRLMKETREL